MGERPFAALRYKDLRWFLAGVTIANSGQFVQAVATPFLVNELTDSPAWVGAVGFAGLAPSVLFTPIAGTLSDRMNRRTLLRGAYAVLLTLTAAMAVLYNLDLLTPWRILGIQLLFGVVIGFQFAPGQAMPAVLVPPESLASGVRLLSFSVTGSRALGPALGGLCLVVAGPGLAFVVSAVFYLTGNFVMAFVNPREGVTATERSLVAEYREGLRYIAARPAMRLAVRTGFVLAMLAASIAFPLAATVNDDLFNGDGGTLGALGTTVGIGSVIGSIFIAGRGSEVALSKMEAVAIALYGTAILVVGSTSIFAVGLLGFGLIGVAHMWHNVSVATSLQLQVDEDFRGRVMSVWLVSVLAGIPVGALLGGFLAEATSTRLVVVLYGTLVGVYLVFAWLRSDRFQLFDAPAMPKPEDSAGTVSS